MIYNQSMSGIKDWAESLPDQCPPLTAHDPSNRTFYRLTQGFPPTAADFVSHRHKKPNARISGISECQRSACSVISTREACTKLLKLPTQKNKKIVSLVLTSGSGVIEQTGREKSHFSWWIARSFDPVVHCKLA